MPLSVHFATARQLRFRSQLAPESSMTTERRDNHLAYRTERLARGRPATRHDSNQILDDLRADAQSASHRCGSSIHFWLTPKAGTLATPGANSA